MTDLHNSRFYDLLPPNLQDANTAALSFAVDHQLREFIDYIPTVLIYANIMGISEKLCDLLAMIFSIRAYNVEFPLDTKRRLIQIVLKTSSKKGTASSVQEVIGAIHGGAKIEEWFDYGGDPYRFKITVDTTKQGIGEHDYEKLIENVDAYKSIRSHMDGITVNLKSEGITSYGGATIAGEHDTLTPEQRTETVKQHMATGAAGILGVISVEHPLVQDVCSGALHSVVRAACVAGIMSVHHPPAQYICRAALHQSVGYACIAGDVAVCRPSAAAILRVENRIHTGCAMLAGDYIVIKMRQGV